MPGPANALNIGQQGTLYFDGVNAFSGIDASTQGHVLTSNGPGIPPSFLAPTGGSGFSSVNIQTFTASGTYTPSADMVYCIIEAVGGGGGGGSFGAASAGGNTTVGALITANGGAAGTSTNGQGGDGGTATGGTLNVKGGGGMGGVYYTSSPGSGGVGGSSFFGGGGVSGGSSAGNGNSYGSGGAGAVGGSNVAAGGGGAGGYSRLFATAATIGASQSITIGSGGAGGASGGNFSTNGGSGADGAVVVTEFIQDSADSPFYSLTPYIVGSDANSEYNTIQAAITQAVADGATNNNQKNIYIKPGTYTEDLTIAGGINLIGFGGDVLLTGTPVIVAGNHTISGNWNAYNLTLNSANNAAILFSGSGNIGLFRCYVQGSAIGVFDGGNTRIQAIMQACEVYAAGALVKTSTATTQLNGVFLYETNIVSGSYVFDLSDLNSSTTAASLVAFNSSISNSLSFLNDPNSICTVIGITSQNSEIPIDCTISPTTCQINVTISGGIVHTPTIDGGNSASTISITNAQVSAIPSISNFSGFNVFWGNLIAVTNSNNPLKSVNKYWSDLSGPLFLGSDQISSQECLQTTNSTPVVLVSVPLNQLESVTVTGTLVGSSADHTDSVGGTYSIVARRASGGNITIVGSATNNVQSTSTATFAVAVNTSTQAVELTITGIAATTYNWSSYYTYQKILLDS